MGITGIITAKRQSAKQQIPATSLTRQRHVFCNHEENVVFKNMKNKLFGSDSVLSIFTTALRCKSVTHSTHLETSNSGSLHQEPGFFVSM